MKQFDLIGVISLYNGSNRFIFLSGTHMELISFEAVYEHITSLPFMLAYDDDISIWCYFSPSNVYFSSSNLMVLERNETA